MRVKYLHAASSLGIPLLGLGILLGCLWHQPMAQTVEPADRSVELLVDPDPRLDKGLTICLRQQSKLVIRYRRSGPDSALARSIANYNLVARECSPTVFEATGLPSSL